jgi:hypothetical protein
VYPIGVSLAEVSIVGEPRRCCRPPTHPPHTHTHTHTDTLHSRTLKFFLAFAAAGFPPAHPLHAPSHAAAPAPRMLPLQPQPVAVWGPGYGSACAVIAPGCRHFVTPATRCFGVHAAAKLASLCCSRLACFTPHALPLAPLPPQA